MSIARSAIQGGARLSFALIRLSAGLNQIAKVTATAAICLIISKCRHINALDVVCSAIKHTENGFRKRVGEFVDQLAHLTIVKCWP
jgi:hypothetical protein